jgi:hypothetical protein
MKFQFSLTTLLVFTAIIGAVCAAAAAVPVADIEQVQRHVEDANASWMPFDLNYSIEISRPPTCQDVIRRVALFGPLAIALALAALWVLRRLCPAPRQKLPNSFS